MFTDTDMRNQVAEIVGNSEGEYDVANIVTEIQGIYGTVNIDQVPAEEFWELVRDNEIV